MVTVFVRRSPTTQNLKVSMKDRSVCITPIEKGSSKV